MRLLLAALFIALTAACGSMQPAPEPANPQENRAFNPRFYRVAIGDKVRIDVYGEPDLSGEGFIDATGSINVPLLGRVGVLGMTAPELEMTLVRKLTGDYLINPNVRVTIVQFRPVYVVGQVGRAGAYPFFDGMTVEKAVAIAGGLTRLASERNIYVMREKSTREARRAASYDTLVYPGDTIIVEESLF